VCASSRKKNSLSCPSHTHCKHTNIWGLRSSCASLPCRTECPPRSGDRKGKPTHQRKENTEPVSTSPKSMRPTTIGHQCTLHPHPHTHTHPHTPTPTPTPTHTECTGTYHCCATTQQALATCSGFQLVRVLTVRSNDVENHYGHTEIRLTTSQNGAERARERVAAVLAGNLVAKSSSFATGAPAKNIKPDL
jgi:hypothetical protein